MALASGVESKSAEERIGRFGGPVLVRLNTRRWLLLLTILMFQLSLINVLYAVDTRDGSNVLTWILFMRAATAGLYFAVFPFLLVSRPRSASQIELAQS